MRTVAKYNKGEGGWKCIIRDQNGYECRTQKMAFQDIETHLHRDHNIKVVRLMAEDSKHPRDLEDWSDNPPVEEVV